jgi:hypothetical protein
MNPVLGPERPANISSGTPTDRKECAMQIDHPGHDSERGLAEQFTRSVWMDVIADAAMLPTPEDTRAMMDSRGCAFYLVSYAGRSRLARPGLAGVAVSSSEKQRSGSRPGHAGRGAAGLPGSAARGASGRSSPLGTGSGRLPWATSMRWPMCSSPTSSTRPGRSSWAWSLPVS